MKCTRTNMLDFNISHSNPLNQALDSIFSQIYLIQGICQYLIVIGLISFNSDRKTSICSIFYKFIIKIYLIKS